MTKLTMIGAAGLLVLTLAACRSTTATTSTTEHVHDTTTTTAVVPDADRTIEVTVSEFTITDIGPIPDFETIEFVVTNTGAVAHEFEITDSHAVEEHLNGGHDDHDTADVGMDMDMGTKITVMPGTTESLIFTFDDPEEQSLVVCLLPGHYEAGMWSEIA